MREYGSFTDMCLEASFAVCNLFPPTIQPTCTLKTTGSISNLANILLSIFSVSILVLVLIRMNRKLAAVGRREMMVLYAGIVIYLCLQLITTSSLLGPDSIHLVRISSIQLSLTFSLFYALVFNAIVGFQFWRDGSRLSMMLMLGGMIAVTGGLSAFNTSRAEAYLLSSSSKAPLTLNDPALFTLYVFWPIFASGCFVGLQFVLVLRSLSARRPLVYLALSAVFFSGGNAVHLLGSVSLCRATGQVVDGAVFDTIFLLFAALALFKFWSDITEDDWDDFRIGV